MLSAADVSALNRVFGYTNRMVTIGEFAWTLEAMRDVVLMPRSLPSLVPVDEAYFLAALGYPSPLGKAVELSLSYPVDVPYSGLRACAFGLLCIGANLADDKLAARAYYDCAQDCLDRALAAERPDQHLVSAVMLMTLVALAAGRDHRELGALSALAHSLAGTLPGRELQGHPLDSRRIPCPSCHKLPPVALLMQCVRRFDFPQRAAAASTAYMTARSLCGPLRKHQSVCADDARVKER